MTLAIGLLAFCLIAVIGLLPTGLNTFQLAKEESRATSALSMVNSAVRSLHPSTSGGASAGNPTWAFPTYFSDNPDPLGTPTIVWVTQAPWHFTFFISEGGTIIPTSDATTPRRQTLYVSVYPPQSISQPVRVYAAVAWPYKPSDTTATDPTMMAGREGFIDTVSAFTPPVIP